MSGGRVEQHAAPEGTGTSGNCGLDEYEVRSWAGWHWHATLSLFALAVVAAIRSRLSKPAGRKGGTRWSR